MNVYVHARQVARSEAQLPPPRSRALPPWAGLPDGPGFLPGLGPWRRRRSARPSSAMTLSIAASFSAGEDRAGAREPEHTHQALSVMIIDSPARIRYYAGGALQFESQARSGAPSGPRVRWMEPEGPLGREHRPAPLPRHPHRTKAAPARPRSPLRVKITGSTSSPTPRASSRSTWRPRPHDRPPSGENMVQIAVTGARGPARRTSARQQVRTSGLRKSGSPSERRSSSSVVPARSWDRLSRSATATRISVFVVIRSPAPPRFLFSTRARIDRLVICSGQISSSFRSRRRYFGSPDAGAAAAGWSCGRRLRSRGSVTPGVCTSGVRTSGVCCAGVCVSGGGGPGARAGNDGAAADGGGCRLLSEPRLAALTPVSSPRAGRAR